MKKIISIALALLMVAVMLPVMAMAEENALPAAGEDGVTVLKDHVVLSSGGFLGSRTIDLNGYTISCTSARGLSFNRLTVRDSSAAGTGAITCKISANATKSSLTLEGGTIAEVEMSGSESSLSISGGKIEKLSLSGSATKIEITDGTVTNGISVSGANANVTVSGGVVGKGFSMSGADSKVTVTGGTFTDITDTSKINKIKKYVDNGVLIISGNGNLYVGASATEAIENAAEGDEFEALQGSDISNVPAGVKITNKTGEVITVNGETIEEGGDYKYTPPTDNKVIVIITPTEDTPKADDQKNPSTGANDFVGVAAALAVVSLLGAAAVIRKK